MAAAVGADSAAKAAAMAAPVPIPRHLLLPVASMERVAKARAITAAAEEVISPVPAVGAVALSLAEMEAMPILPASAPWAAAVAVQAITRRLPMAGQAAERLAAWRSLPAQRSIWSIARSARILAPAAAAVPAAQPPSAVLAAAVLAPSMS